MNLSLVALALIALTVAGYVSGRRRALAVAGGGRLHSLPRYYGAQLAIWVSLPSFAVLALWLAIGPEIVAAVVMDGLPPELVGGSAGTRALVLAEIRDLARGAFVGREADAALTAAGRALCGPPRGWAHCRRGGGAWLRRGRHLVAAWPHRARASAPATASSGRSASS